jgi:hypothetical protein
MADRPDLIQSELAGLAFDSAQSIFRSKDIDEMFSQEPFNNVVSEDVYITVDPAAGGPQVALLTLESKILYPKSYKRNSNP